MGTETDLPSRAQVVIIGGGIVGTSVAYHLTRLGWFDVVLVEQGQLSSGTTWHAAGLLGQLRATEGGTRLVQYSAQLYSELEVETGLATGFKRCGGVTVARTEERMVQLRRTAATAEVYGLECELITPDQARERYPVLATDGSGRRHLAARRRDGQPGRRHGLTGQGRPRQGGEGGREDPGAGHRPVGRPGHRSGHRPGPDRGRGGGELRRAVGESRRGAGRCERPAALGRALLRGVRADRGCPCRPADPARPGRVHLLQRGGGWPGHRGLRARGQAVGGSRPDPLPVRVPTPGRGLGPLLRPDGECPAPHTCTQRDGHPEVLQRSRELHPRQPVHHRRGPRTPELLRGCRVQLGGHRLGRRGRTGPGRVDRRGGADRRPGGPGHPAVRPLQREQPVAPRPGGRDPRAPLRGPVAQPGTGHRPAVPALTGVPPARGGRGPVRVEDGMGAGERVRPGRGGAGTPTTPGTDRTGWPGRPRSSAGPGRRSPSSTRHRSESSSSRAGTPRPCSSGCARPMWPLPSAGRSTPAC